jgi:hypothetical protein
VPPPAAIETEAACGSDGVEAAAAFGGGEADGATAGA